MSLPTTNYDQSHTETRHGSINISFSQILSLMGTLISLRLLRALSSITNGRKPARESIEQTEDHIMTLFEDIVPESLYRPHSRCTFLCDGPLEARSSNRQNMDVVGEPKGPSSSMAGGGGMLPKAARSQCLSRSSGERARELVRQSVEGMGEDNQVVNFSGNVASSQEGRGLSVSEDSRLNSFASSFPACPPPQNTPVSGVPYLTNVMEQEQRQEQEQKREREKQQDQEQTQQRRVSFTNQQQRMSVDESDPDHDLDIVNAYPVDDDEEELRRVRSAESYPGKFPVSDGLELCALASAPFYRIGKGSASVRPFSDV